MDDFFVPGSFLLATITQDNWHIYGVLMGIIITALMVYDRIDSIRHRNKENPPNHEIYLTKEEAAKMEMRHNKSIGVLEGKQDELNRSFQNHTISISKTLGKLEGQMAALMLKLDND